MLMRMTMRTTMRRRMMMMMTAAAITTTTMVVMRKGGGVNRTLGSKKMGMVVVATAADGDCGGEA